MEEREADLPQPGLDEPSPDTDGDDHPTSGPGGVTIEEPTEPALDPERDEFDEEGETGEAQQPPEDDAG